MTSRSSSFTYLPPSPITYCPLCSSFPQQRSHNVLQPPSRIVAAEYCPLSSAFPQQRSHHVLSPPRIARSPHCSLSNAAITYCRLYHIINQWFKAYNAFSLLVPSKRIMDDEMMSLAHNQNDELRLAITEDDLTPQSFQEGEQVPYCDEELKPKVGQVFDTLEDGEKFYKSYAHSVGFSVRCSSENKNKNGVIRWKYFPCSNEGYKPDTKKDVEQSESTIKTRKRNLTKEGCNAKVAFKLLDGGKYELTRFHESHTHAFASPSKIS